MKLFPISHIYMEKRVFAFFGIFLVLIVNIKVSAQTISDKEFFQVLNLNYPGLRDVKKYVEKNNFALAKKEYVAYLKNRKSPIWIFDWRDRGKSNPSVSIQEADKYANNELVSVGIWHKFGPTVNWKLNPTENNYKEWTWQLNRHYFWPTLGRAYWKTGDECYARAFVSQLKSWLSQCNRPNDSANYQGPSWRTLEAGIRMMSTWPNAFFYFLSSPSFEDEIIFMMVKSFYEHCIYLRTNYNPNDGNLVDMNGLFAVSTIFPEFLEAKKWQSFAVEKLYLKEKEQFYPDGSHIELAPGYHGTNLSCFASVYRLAQINNYDLPIDYVSRMENIFEYYQRLLMPNGKIPALNDSRWSEGSDYLTKAVDIFPSRKDFYFSNTRGKKGIHPSYTSVWMPWAGWYIMRSGWDIDDFYALFEVGPYGTMHQHEDKLSFILFAYGSKLITECGNYAYDSSEWRVYAKSARGHNVARVDGEDQNRFVKRNNKNVAVSSAPLTNRFISTKKYDLGEGFYTEGYGDESNSTVTHHRTLRFVKNKYWLVTDEFIPSDSSLHTYDIWFHFNTDLFAVDRENNAIYSTSSNEANIAIVRLGDFHEMNVIVGAKTPEVQGWISETVSGDGFEMRRVATPVFYGKGIGVKKEYFVFIPVRKGEVSGVKRVRRLSTKKYSIYMENGKRYNITLTD